MAKLSKRAQDQPLQLCQVLLEELRHLRPYDAGLRASGFTGPRCLADLFKLVHSWSAEKGAAAGKPAEGAAGRREEAKEPLKAEAKEATETSGAGTSPLTALCFSGGGIRSATFNLGVLQGLAQSRLLGSFDYLSSVSGGGYIASWLRTWMHREGTAAVIAQLQATKPADSPLSVEPKPVANLREYSNYLTPQLGLLSGDTWSAAAIILRNLILNWL